MGSNRQRSFLADPAALIELHRRQDEGTLRLVALYHSHPSGRPALSDLDREMAGFGGRPAFPDLSWLVCGIPEGSRAVHRAWSWERDRGEMVERALKPVPLVSVLLPVRNAQSTLPAALNSILRQRLTDLELIAVDDGSTDASREILDRAAEGEPRVRVIGTGPRGVAEALRVALRHAQGELIARMDADDVCHPDRLSEQLQLLERDWLDVVGCRFAFFPSREVPPGMARYAAWQNGLIDHQSMAADRFVECPLTHGTMLARRGCLERVGGWRETGGPEDLDLILRLFEAGARFGKVERILYRWRERPGRVTRQDPRMTQQRFHECRMTHLMAGPLAGVSAVDLWGRGAPLERWAVSLEDRGVRVATRVELKPAELIRPRGGRSEVSPGLLPGLQGERLLLCYGSARPRDLLRRALQERGSVEGREFHAVG